MAEIAMVLRGDIALILVMPEKRDELRIRFHIGDEARLYYPRNATTVMMRNYVSWFLNVCSAERTNTAGAATAG
jgi:hypothetical protein